MIRIYPNPNPDSPIQAVVLRPHLFHPRVQLNKEIQDERWNFVKEGQDWCVKDKRGYPLCTVSMLVDELFKAKLMDATFKESVFNAERAFYHQEKAERLQRHVYECPAKSLIESIIIQDHSGFHCFVRYAKENELQVSNVLHSHDLSADPMFSEFENFGILGHHTKGGDLSVFTALERLQRAGLIDEALKKRIVKEEGKRIETPPKNRYPHYLQELNKRMNTLLMAPKVKSGAHAGQLPRDIRELKTEFDLFNQNDLPQERLKKMARIAKVSYPALSRVAEQCLNHFVLRE